MARSTRKTTTSTRRTTTTSTKPQDAENAPQSAVDDPGVEPPADDAESAPEADSGPSDDVPADDAPDVDAEEPEKEPKSKSASEKKGESLNSADSSFETDENGNAEEPALPNRATKATTLYPFGYEENSENGTITTTERVYSVMRYYGTTRKGRAFAYPKGAVLSKAVLSLVDEDA